MVLAHMVWFGEEFVLKFARFCKLFFYEFLSEIVLYEVDLLNDFKYILINLI